MQRIKRYIDKFKSGGLRWIVRVGKYKVSHWGNILIFHICQLFPIKKGLIVFESEGDFCDNAYALFEYMQKNGYMDKYRAVWLVEHPEIFKECKIKNTTFCYKNDDKLNFVRDYYTAVCGHYIYDHNLVLYGRRKGQRVTYITHGVSFKMNKDVTDEYLNDVNEIVSLGNYSGKYHSYFYYKDDDVTLHLGYPRNDYLFVNNHSAKNIVTPKFEFSKYSRVFLWMPTFRKSRVKGLSEDYIKNETGLPLFNTMQELENFNAYLRKENLLLILKVHQLSANLPIYHSGFSNILILKNKDIEELGLQLYQFISCTDALITDYSSISFDYLLLDRPIIYTLDDYEDYAKSRGLYPDNAKDYMPGYHVTNMKELEDSINEINSGVDCYAEERHKIRELFHDHIDGNSSKRIVEYLGL